ncbi:hypothetical protein QM012_000057 [Aureobasidium pullulans]|uniref:Uncharacterized protein n=1 Tax=Aureobasidium pullulans TaxID=5580 RepID=A0ABR0TVA7_AURPU
MPNFDRDYLLENYRKTVNRGNEKPTKDDQALRTRSQQECSQVFLRMWSAESGGNYKLNTITAVTPLALATSKGHKSVYNMTRSELVKNTTSHLGGCITLTGFSSWSHSPYFSFYITHQRRWSSTFSSKIFSNGAYIFEEEHLVHGIIKRQFHKAIPLQQIMRT